MRCMRFTTLALLLLVLPAGLAAQEQLSPPQQGYTFQGTNLRWFGINTRDNKQAHALCRAECAKDPNCRAYSLVLAGAFRPEDNPVCYLMASVQSTVPSNCCIIAAKQPSAPPAPRSHTFINPVVNLDPLGNQQYRVDRCLSFGQQCDEPAASAWCRSQGYVQSIDSKWEYSATPTYTLGDHKICPGGCGALHSVTCAW